MSDLVIPQSHIDLLRENKDNPSYHRVFDKRYGAGAAKEALNPTQATPSDTEGLTFREKVWDVAKAPVAGLEDAVTGTAKFINTYADPDWFPKVVWGDGRIRIVAGEELAQMHKDGLLKPDAISGTVENMDLVQDSETITGGVVQGISNFAIPYFGLFGKTISGGKIVAGMAAGAAVDGIVIDPDDPNLTAGLESLGVDLGAFGDLMATDPDSPDWVNRARGVGEGIVLGGVIETIRWGLKAHKARLSGDEKQALEFAEEAKKAASKVDDLQTQHVNDMAADAEETIKGAERVFASRPEVDGQVRLDLDVPADAPVPRMKQGFRITPEREEQIRYVARLAMDQPEHLDNVQPIFRNIDTVGGMDDITADLSAVVEVFADEIDKARGGSVQRWETVKAQSYRKAREMAETLGTDPDELYKRFAAGSNNHAHMASEMLARATLIKNVTAELSELSTEIATSKITKYATKEEAILKHRALREIQVNLFAQDQAHRTNVARTLSAMRLVAKQDKALREMIELSIRNGDDETIAKEIAAVAANGGDVAKKSLELGDYIQQTADVINNYRINALLSGVGTQEVNLVSNVLNSVVLPVQQIMGGNFKHGARTLRYQLGATFDAWQLAKKAFVDDESILDSLSSKFDFDLAKGKKNAVETVINLPSRFLLAMDEFFKQSTYRGRIMADALEEADKLGLTGIKREVHVQAAIKQAYDAKGHATNGAALKYAQEVTFTQQLTGGAAKFQAIGQGKGALATGFRFVLPFIRTPMNILQQSFRNMPVIQNLSMDFNRRIFKGGMEGAKARGQLFTAWAIGGALYAYAGQGKFTGQGPTDPRIRAEWLKNNRPYSIRIENDDGTVTWRSYQRYEPLANVIATIADMNQIMSDPYNELETSKVPLAAAMFLAIANNTTNKTFTRGLSDFLDLLQGNNMTAEKAGYNLIGSFVPNILNQTNGDEAFRVVRSAQDAILSRTHLYNGVDPRRNVLGEVITRPLNKMDPLGLFSSDTITVDRVIEEMSRVSMQDRSAFSQPTSRYFVDGKMVDLRDTPWQEGNPQSMYDRLVELTGTVEIGGKNLRERLEQVMNSRDYQKAPDGSVGISHKDTKGAIIAKIINEYRKKAKSEFPEFIEFYKEHKRSQRETLFEQFKTNKSKLKPLTLDFN